MLSDKKKLNYLHNTIAKNFKQCLPSEVRSILYDTGGVIIAATPKATNEFLMDDLVGYDDMSIFEISNQKLFYVGENYTVDFSKELKSVCQTLLKIHQRVVESKEAVSCMSFMPYGGAFKALALTDYPILHNDGELVGVQTIATEVPMLGIQDYLHISQQSSSACKHHLWASGELPVPLTSRQHEILFLLLQGFSQRQVASILQINRGTVSKSLELSICPKFKINPSNTRALIAKARNHGFHNYVPKNLCKPLIITQDQVLNLSNSHD